MVAPLPKPGELVAGRYFVVGKLAAGGMGLVLAARDEAEGGRPVALKLLHPELARDPEMVRRFRREGAVLRSLDHPSIVRMYDIGGDDRGRLFTVMELLEGETLLARIEREGPLALELVLTLARGVGAALDAVHGHGVLHGDLKPANVFLVDEGGALQVKLVDFGTSKVHGLERLTRTGEVVGTPIFMAPELLTGDGSIDARIDVYAFGVLLYEALAGAPAFTERNPGKLLFQIVMGQAVPLAERRATLPPHVVAAVARAMSPKKDTRFESALALVAALEGR
ncbi:MAG: serine/threonine protein kinase [Myxococcales bacterium]|nr:serine/threonine protein kinase [Myxococcales bacterium]